MFSWESRRTRRNSRGARRPDITAVVESLEARELMAANALGASLPDLTVTGFAPSVAAWGNPITVTVNVSNIGVNSTLEPLALAPGSTSSADAPASTVGVYATRNPRSLAGSVLVGTVDVPAVSANNVIQVSQSFTLPTQPFGLPGDGGRVYLFFKANANGDVLESDTTNNNSPPVSVTIQAPLPELVAVGLDVPPVMQPGDTIQPNIRIANLGAGDPALQGVPIQVALVASRTRNFTPYSSVVALYTVSDVPPQALVPTQVSTTYADANLDPTSNIVTIAGDPVTLPWSPNKYYLGVVVDPYGLLKQIRTVPQDRSTTPQFSLIQKVGPSIYGLPPAGVNVDGGTANTPVFPYPFGGNPVGSVASSSTITTAGVSASSTSLSPGLNTFAAGTSALARRTSILGMLRNTGMTYHATTTGAVARRLTGLASNRASSSRLPLA